MRTFKVVESDHNPGLYVPITVDNTGDELIVNLETLGSVVIHFNTHRQLCVDYTDGERELNHFVAWDFAATTFSNAKVHDGN